jgi:Thiamine pyrophosphate enzyme, N-terminal TPP binding domain
MATAQQIADPKTEMALEKKTGADIVVETLEARGVTHVFGLPGAKIDKVFDRLRDSRLKTVVCRHEQNAALIAGGIGRMTGKAGVALVTSGPGASNLATGLATANTEGDPIVALGGAVAVAGTNALRSSFCFALPAPKSSEPHHLTDRRDLNTDNAMQIIEKTVTPPENKSVLDFLFGCPWTTLDILHVYGFFSVFLSETVVADDQ